MGHSLVGGRVEESHFISSMCLSCFAVFPELTNSFLAVCVSASSEGYERC